MKHQWFLESNFADNSNDNSTFVAYRAMSKGSKVGLHNVYLAAFEYFRPGIMRFDRPIRIKHVTPAPGLLIHSPGYEVAVGPLNSTKIGFGRSTKATCHLSIFRTCMYPIKLPTTFYL